MHRPLSRSAARAAVLATALLATVVLGGGAAAIQGAGTPTPDPKVGKGPERARGPVPDVAFTCDPSKNHGQNVSAYVHALPKGPGRGRQVSQVAKSDCGKTR